MWLAAAVFLAGPVLAGAEPDHDTSFSRSGVHVSASRGGKVERDSAPVPGSLVVPAYPWAAREARLGGHVQLSGTVGKDGRVSGLECLDCGTDRAGFVAAARAAIEHWIYQPALAPDGSPVAVSILFDVRFKP